MATLNQTTLSAACTVTSNTIVVASASNITAPVNNQFQKLWILDPGTYRGELVMVTAVNSTTITISRLDEFRAPHLSGSLVLIQSVDPTLGIAFDPVFVEKDPNPAPATTPVNTQVINVVTGMQWLYSSVLATWVPGWGNYLASPQVTAAVASASSITPSGPLFHVTGTTSTTTITLPTGFAGGEITVIADGVWPWATGGNIALASGTVVALSTIKFVYDWHAALWYPSTTV